VQKFVFVLLVAFLASLVLVIVAVVSNSWQLGGLYKALNHTPNVIDTFP